MTLRSPMTLLAVLPLCLHAGMAAAPEAAAPQRKPKITVAVKLAVDPSGFVGPQEKQLKDSVGDLRKELRKKDSRLAVVEKPEEADIVLEVLTRGVRAAAGGLVVHMPNSPISLVANNQEGVLHAVMIVGEYRTELIGKAPTWGGAAGQIAKQVDEFAKTNYEKVLGARRKS